MPLLPAFLFVGLAIAAAVPEAATKTNKPFCSSVKSGVTQVSEHLTATAFCYSYLSITDSTVTASATSTSWILPGEDNACVTNAATSKKRAADAATADLARREMEARATKTRPEPSAFSAYTNSAQLSSACSCLTLRPTTTTTTPVATSTGFRVQADYNEKFLIPYKHETDNILEFKGLAHDGLLFTLDPNNNCALTDPGTQTSDFVCLQSTSNGADAFVYFYQHVPGDDSTLVSCHLDGTTNALSCAGAGGSIDSENRDFWHVGSGSTAGDKAVNLLAVA